MLRKNNIKMKDQSLKKIYIKSYGCQMNVYDSNRIKDSYNVLN